VTDGYRKDAEPLVGLTPWKYKVAEQNATEPAFENELWGLQRGKYLDGM